MDNNTESLPAIGVFMKSPREGHVKTRLGESIGMKNATEFYAVSLGWFLQRLRHRDLPFVLFYDRSEDESYIRRMYGLTSDQPMVVQNGSNLGERMFEGLKWLDQEPSSVPLIVGSDSPDLPIEWIRDGIQSLNQRQLILGPATDGGYYLIGYDNPSYDLFDGVDWSTSEVLTQTLDRANKLNLNPRMLPEWNDIDTLDDLMERLNHRDDEPFTSQ